MTMSVPGGIAGAFHFARDWWDAQLDRWARPVTPSARTAPAAPTTRSRLSSPILTELRHLRPAYLALFAFSFFTPLLYLASPIYVEQIFDRVMYSRNMGTLMVLTIIATFLIAMYCLLEWLRKRTLARLGNSIDEQFSRVMFETLHRPSAAQAVKSPTTLTDFNTVREFLSGNMLTALFDAAWAPLFIIVLLIVHWVFGVIALAMVALTGVLGWLNHRMTKQDTQRFQQMSIKSQEFGHAISRNVEAVRALGMLVPLRDRWYGLHSKMLGWQFAAGSWIDIFAYIVKFIRTYQMIGIYAVGTILYLNNEITMANTFIAMTLLMRGLAPIDQVISNWRGYSNFSAALGRLDDMIRDTAETHGKIALARLTGPLQVSRVFAFAPGGERPILNDVSFTLGEGRILGVIGPSGAGKSCLARVLVGVWPPRAGSIAIGDHDLSHWNEDVLGQRLGYMPQDVELLPGTIADNIARFDPETAGDLLRVIAATELAGIQDLIRALPNGYNTKVGPGEHVLSGGQRSRVAIARAVYGDPSFVVLDEPNADLDSIAEQAFVAMLQKLRARRATIVIITHKLNILSHCDDVLVLNSGTVQAFGPREQIVSRIPRLTALPSLTVVKGALESQAS
jgi:PrtD family type I secretion system ABC transporter